MEIAIIGMAGRFPSSENIEEFWDNMLDGRDCIERQESLHTKKDGVEYINAYGNMEGIYLFDNALFGISDSEAELMEPQERQFLECAYLAMCDAGYESQERKETVGVICGEPENEYYLKNRFENADKNGVAFQNEKFHYSGGALVGRVAYKLNLRGPAIRIDTACSTSLSSVIMAADMIREGYADMMIAGGTNIDIGQGSYIHIEGMSSADGVVRPFDKNSTGMVPGNGVGAVVLKDYNSALEDGDYIYAVIKGGYLCNDGNNKIGYTSPSVEGEVRAIEGAMKKSGIESGQIDYIETHGTATVLGDAIELKGIKKVFKRTKNSPLPIGSLKGNFGHLNMAAGIAGIIKGCLILERQIIPPSINHTETNPELSEKDYIYIPREKILNSEISNIGISSFGLGGMNSHIILSRHDNTCGIKKQKRNVRLNRKEFILKQKKTEEKKIAPEHIREILGWIITEESGASDFSGEKGFEDCAIESMEQIVICSRISQEFGIEFTMSDFYECDCIEDIAGIILDKKVMVNKKKIEEFEDIGDLFDEL